MNDHQIFASATVDQELQHIQGGSLKPFRVTVTGLVPHDYVRRYGIRAKDDAAAASEGIQKFVEEISEFIKERADD